jgi:uncharacterized lipoprotein YehR (DUF1307 family)
MKKLSLVILLMLTIFTLSGCKGDEEIIEVDEFDIFKEILSAYSVNDTNGITVDVEQILGATVIHKQHITQRIDRSSDLTAKTIYYEREIGPFDVEKAYIETEVTTYYRNGQMITQVEGEDLVYEEVTMDSYIDSELIIQGLIKDNFVDYQIQILDSLQILTGELKIGSVRSIFGTDISMVNTNEMTIIINANTKRFIEFSFTYTSDQTSTTFTFTPYYDDVEIVIPSQE